MKPENLDTGLLCEFMQLPSPSHRDEDGDVIDRGCTCQRRQQRPHHGASKGTGQAGVRPGVHPQQRHRTEDTKQADWRWGDDREKKGPSSGADTRRCQVGSCFKPEGEGKDGGGCYTSVCLWVCLSVGSPGDVAQPHLILPGLCDPLASASPLADRRAVYRWRKGQSKALTGVSDNPAETFTGRAMTRPRAEGEKQRYKRPEMAQVVLAEVTGRDTETSALPPAVKCRGDNRAGR